MDADGGVQRRKPGPRHARGRHRARRSRTRSRLIAALAFVVVVALGASAGLHFAGSGHTHPGVAVPLTRPSTTSAPTPTPSSEVHARPGVSPSVASTPTPSATVLTVSPTPAPTLTPDVVALRIKAIEVALAQHATALLHRDPVSFAATLDPSSAAFRAAQLAVYANTAGVPFQSWFYEVSPADVKAATVPRAGQLLVAVTLRYALRGFDPQPTALREYLTFLTTSSAAGWLLASDTDGEASGERSARDLWDFGPVVVTRGALSLVLSHPAGQPLARTLASAADAAVPRVTAFWGTRWAGKVVILVPASTDELRQIVGTTQDLSQIAALATAEISTSARGESSVGDRVAINPSTFATLGTLGRRVVMTHEITHVATRSVTAVGTPTWLVEGIADYVGFKGTSTAVRFDASELGRQVDEGHLPSGLPSGADFARDAGSGTALATDYEEAWMACKFIVSRTSEASLIAFYKAVGTGQGAPDAVLAAAFADVLHTDQATFTASWQSYVAVSLK